MCTLELLAFRRCISARCDVLIVCRFNSKLSDIMEPQNPISDTKMDSRIQSV